MSKFSDKAKQVIAAVAPTIGVALGGPFGGLAGTVLARALGVEGKDPANEQAIEAAIAGGDPEVLLKLKTAEQNFIARMEELGIQREQLEVQDRDSARKREVEVKDRTPAFLAYIITIGFFGTLGWLMIHGKPETGGDALLVMLGSLGTAWAGVTAYYYGSTKGSQDKTRALSDIAKMT